MLELYESDKSCPVGSSLFFMPRYLVMWTDCTVVHALLDAGANLYEKDRNGVTALHRAAYSDRAVVI